MEAHPPLEKWATQNNQLQKKLKTRLEKLADEHGAVIDWQRVEDALNRADGIPTPVLQNAMTLTEIKSEAVQVSRPAQLYGKPTVTELTEADWSVVTERLDSETEAQKLAAMLNHQGPQIPARKIEKDGEYRVVAGPFKNKKETKLIAKRIKSSFDMEVTPVKPQVIKN
jgi:L,D-transpeptidase ErfK/SrfK